MNRVRFPASARPTLLGACVLAASCAAPAEIPKEDFGRWTADIVCDRTQECMRGNFDSAFFGMADCRATLTRAYDDLADQMDDMNCDYSAKRAGDAWVDIADMSCESFYEGDANEATTDVWENCGGFTTFPPYTTSTFTAF